jgi:hypothetical protein
VPTLERVSRRAGRSLERLASERPARAAIGAAAAGAAAAGVAAAGKAVAERLRPADDGPSRTYRLKCQEKPAEGLKRIAAGRADSALEHLEAIKRRQQELLVPATRLGARIYADKPKHFVRRIGEYWHAWRPDGVRTAAPAKA